MSPAPVGLDAPAAAGTDERQTLTHAWLDVREPSGDGSLAQAGPSIGQIPFQFNPKELTLAKAAQWARPTTKGNKRSSPPQYQGPQPSKLTLEMFFDASDKHDNSVVKRVELLFACCVPTTKSHDKKKDSPPWVLFRWGGLTGFLAYISSVSAKYTLFTAAGLPIRATCTVTLEELAGDPPKQARAASRAPARGGRHPRWHRVRGVRRPGCVAGGRRGQRDRRPHAAAPGTAAPAPRGRSAAPPAGGDRRCHLTSTSGRSS
jgi:hypothetical protein